MTLNRNELQKTARGFVIYDEFFDCYGTKITVQESSNIYGGIWIYSKNDKGEDFTPHLSVDDARRLVKALRVGISDQLDLVTSQRKEWGPTESVPMAPDHLIAPPATGAASS